MNGTALQHGQHRRVVRGGEMAAAAALVQYVLARALAAAVTAATRTETEQLAGRTAR